MTHRPTIREFRKVHAEGSHYASRQIDRLSQVLTLDSRKLLTDVSQIAEEVADQHAENQYETFRIRQDAEHVSDFDLFAARALEATQNGEADGND